jgi:SNF2 family DNA or RNA helicase
VVAVSLKKAARFAPELAVLDYRGLGRRHLRERFAAGHVAVTTYGTLRRDATVLKDVEFDCVVPDEAQAIKNASSQAAKAARLLRAEQRLALSGTPVENHLGELWSLFEFLNPGMLGTSAAFKRLGARPGVNAGREHVDFLARALRPFFLRRTKDEVLDDLPPKTEQTLHCELSRTERRRYDELREHYRTALFARADEVGIERMKIHVLEGLLRLRQAACHPALLDPARAGDGSAKVDTLLEQLAAVVEEGHKALVFSQFTKLLAVVRSRLDAAGHAYEYLDGRTRKRREKVARFQSDPDCPLFLISLKAGGHGLNLTAADYVFLLDPWWNPAVEAQAIDRAHRIGQRRTVVAYRLIARDTVEEKVVELQDSKRELAAALFGGERGALRDMTREDLELLLS